MIRALLIALALVFTAAAPAEAASFNWVKFFHKGPVIPTPPASPDLIPGATPPAVNGTTVDAVVNNITPVNFGNSGDYGYNIRGWGRWVNPQLMEAGYGGNNNILQIGAVFAHVPTDAELAAGTGNNLCSVDARVDQGAWFNIPSQSVDNSAGGITDWNATIHPANFADGIHQVDFVGKPCTGPSIIMQGPLENATHFSGPRAQTAKIDDGNGGAGQLLTVTVGPTSIMLGASVEGVGTLPNTFIDGDNTHNQNSCIPYTGGICTGTGGTGTYHVTVSQLNLGSLPFTASMSGTAMTVTAAPAGNGLSPPGQSIFGAGVTVPTTITGDSTHSNTLCVASTGSNCTGSGGTGTYAISASQTVTPAETMGFGVSLILEIERSYFFITNHGGLLCGGGHTCRSIVYADIANGNDSTGTGTEASPKQHIKNAMALINSQSGNSGLYGGTVCLKGNAAITSNAGSGATPGSTLGQTILQRADVAPCASATDSSQVTVTFNSSNRTYADGVHVWYRYMGFVGHPDTLNGALPTQLTVEHVSTVGGIYSGGLVGAGGYACLETTITFAAAGCVASISRNETMNYMPTDPWHGPELIIGGHANYLGSGLYWATGDTTSGSQVISNISAPMGYTLQQIFGGGGTCSGGGASSSGCIGVASGVAGANCFPESATITYITGIEIDGPNTLHTSQPATCTGTGQLIYASESGGPINRPHVDGMQWQVGTTPWGDIIVTDNFIGDISLGDNAGVFVENSATSGFYIARNYVGNSASSIQSIWFVRVNQGNLRSMNDHQIFDSNIWDTHAGYRQDYEGSSNDETFVNDQCVNGNPSVTGSGTNRRRKARASLACYSTFP